jgi:hypothetical protein
MSKHTKGPWKVSIDNDYRIIAQYQNKDVANTYLGMPKNRLVELEWKANARLIASAPELLEACKKLHKELKELWLILAQKGAFPETIDLHTKDLDFAEQAIARAEGVEKRGVRV